MIHQARSHIIAPPKKLMVSTASFCRGLPKGEFHVHFEGTLKGTTARRLARRNGIRLKFKSISELRAAYKYTCLQDFLDLYYELTAVLICEQDFYEVGYEYFQAVAKQNVRRVEMFFDPQAHTSRGVSFRTVVTGLHRACVDAGRDFGISAELIMCFLRHLTEEEAMKTLEEAIPYKSWILAVGLDSGEKGNPPRKFVRVFEQAKRHGFLRVAHAGEEGPPANIWEAIELLEVDGIDHGVSAVQDPKLVSYLAQNRMRLTMCPLSGLALCVVNTLEQFPLETMLHADVCASINSDDPAYFGGTINPNYVAIQRALHLSRQDMIQIAKNGFEGAFIPQDEKDRYIDEVDRYVASVEQ